MNYVDAHVHVWTDDLTRYPIAAGYSKRDVAPATFCPEKLFSHTTRSGVTRVVLIQIGFYGFDNSYMLEVMCRYRSTFSGVAVIDWHAPSPGRDMRRLAEQGVRGFRIYPKDAAINTWLDGPGIEHMFATGAEHNLAICPLINVDALPALDRRCEQFPQTPVIIDHLCRIGANEPIRDTHIERLCAMARHSKVMVKVSAFYALGKKTAPYDDLYDLIRRVYNAFGPQRLMWASDSPYQLVDHTYEDSIRLIRDRLDFLTESDKDQFLRKTAEDFFFSDS